MIYVHVLDLDALTVRVEACEQGRSLSEDMTALKININGLRLNVDEVKYVDISTLLGMVDLPNVPSKNLPSLFEFYPGTTIRDVVVADKDVDSDSPRTDEEGIGA